MDLIPWTPGELRAVSFNGEKFDTWTIFILDILANKKFILLNPCIFIFQFYFFQIFKTIFYNINFLKVSRQITVIIKNKNIYFSLKK